MVPQCDLNPFSLRGGKPTFPEQQDVTLSLCPDNQYGIFYNNYWGIARYTLYKITAAQAHKAKTDPVPRPKGDPWKQTPGINHQGSKDLYKYQPIPCLYDRGHVVPVNILRYSDESARATFTFTNCVPQIAGFNRGQWKKYETKIVQYAQHYCAPEGGTLYLITGTSQVKFEEILGPQNVITGVDGSVQQMEAFHDDVDTYPQHGPKIFIPNSMWTVGCCLGLNNKVVGAFGVMGGNYLNQQLLNEFMMPRQTVASVQEALQLEDKSIELFPNGGDCYDPSKQVEWNKIPLFYVP
ncbi:unnamed protein product [Pocillopora meandrina]|uniref:Uncharacterized protein n=1 Tax=Pocillopora meandrina TaxID=46732 RepID=A0AAU9XDK6_9CNID|nr:unnamed protein product [Pocillopora meandrina]